MEAQNVPTPTGQLALRTWAKSSFFVLILHSAIYGHMWHFSICAKKNPPPVREKTFRRLQNHRLSKSKHILIQQKRFERKSSSQLWERRFWKCPRWCSVKYVGWRFFTKTPKIVRFTNSDKIFDSNLFYWTRNTLYFTNIHDISSLLVITRPYSSFFVIFCLSGGTEKARKIPENEQ